MVFRWGKSLGTKLGFHESVQNRLLAKILVSFMCNSVASFNVQITWVHLGCILRDKNNINIFEIDHLYIILTWIFVACVSVVCVLVTCILVSQITTGSLGLILMGIINVANIQYGLQLVQSAWHQNMLFPVSLTPHKFWFFQWWVHHVKLACCISGDNLIVTSQFVTIMSDVGNVFQMNFHQPVLLFAKNIFQSCTLHFLHAVRVRKSAVPKSGNKI